MPDGFSHTIADRVLGWLTQDARGEVRLDAGTLTQIKRALEQATEQGEGTLAAGALLELASLLREPGQHRAAELLRAVAVATLVALANRRVDIGAVVDHTIEQSHAFRKFSATPAEPATAPTARNPGALLGSLGRLKNF